MTKSNKNLRMKATELLLKNASKDTYLALEDIKDKSKMSQDKLKEYADEKLKKLLMHAYNNVPYYTKVLKNAKVIDENNNVVLDNFDKIPILTKEILREEYENLKAKNLSEMKWYFNTSGGSSGEPARFIQSNIYSTYNVANKIFYKINIGAHIGGRELRLWGSERDILEGKEDPKILIRNKLYNRKEINMFKLYYPEIPIHLETWDKFKPEWVEGYVHVMIEFAKYALENKIKVHAPLGILCTAGTLDYNMRKTIEKAFNTKVYNRYGSREVGDIACEDNTNKGLRISVWNQKVEILDEKMKPTNEMGKVFITNLNNYAMPLIRYEIGDMAFKGDNWDYIKNVSGRITSIFKTKDGGFFDGCYFRTILSYKDWIKQFQIIQKDYENIEYIFVRRDKNYKMPQKEKDELTENVRKLLGENCIVTFKFVDKIEGLKSGKYLYTKSEI